MSAAELAHVEDAIAEAARPERALAALLAAWRLQPAPALAAAIDELAPRLPGLPREITKHRHWRGVLAAGRVVDVAALTTALRYHWAIPELLPLAAAAATPGTGLARDPRITVAVVDHLARVRGADRDRLVEHLIELGDARTIAPLARYLGDDAAAVVALRARAAVTAVLAPDVVAALARYDAARTAHLAAERVLLDEVYATPDDDGPRQVYGDWLQGHGDPRGEFIALQFRRHRGRMSEAERGRERVLTDAYRRAWLDGLANPAVEPRGYQRGFVAEVGLDRVDAALPLLTHPAWATVRAVTLSCQLQDHVAQVVTMPSWRSLRSLAGVNCGAVVALAVLAAPLGIEHLEIVDDGEDRGPALAPLPGPGLAAVTSLRLHVALAGLPMSTLLPQLRRLQVVLDPGQDDRWLARILADGGALERVDIATHGLAIALSTGTSRLSRLEVAPSPTEAQTLGWIVDRDLIPLIGALPADSLTELVVVGHRTDYLDAALAPLRSRHRELTAITYRTPS